MKKSILITAITLSLAVPISFGQSGVNEPSSPNGGMTPTSATPQNEVTPTPASNMQNTAAPASNMQMQNTTAPASNLQMSGSPPAPPASMTGLAVKNNIFLAKQVSKDEPGSLCGKKTSMCFKLVTASDILAADTNADGKLDRKEFKAAKLSWVKVAPNGNVIPARLHFTGIDIKTNAVQLSRRRMMPLQEKQLSAPAVANPEKSM